MTQPQLSLVHLIHEPTARSTASPPLLLLLHGIGSYEGDLMSLAPYLDGRFFVVSARAPLSIGPGSYAWYRVDFSGASRTVLDSEESGQSRELLLRFVGECVESYGLDERRVFLMGFSQGAIMTLGVTLATPERFAGAVAMSGRILPDLMLGAAPAERLDGFPVLVVHGTEDAVLPIEEGRNIRSVLEKLPVRLEYHEYEMGHQVSAESLADVNRWLAARLDKSESSLRTS